MRAAVVDGALLGGLAEQREPSPVATEIRHRLEPRDEQRGSMVRIGKR
jgi:hypothetical protein